VVVVIIDSNFHFRLELLICDLCDQITDDDGLNDVDTFSSSEDFCKKMERHRDAGVCADADIDCRLTKNIHCRI
jgi:hypothetical protein